MADDAKIVIDIDADASGTKKGVDDAKGHLSGLESHAKSMTGTMMKLGGAIAGAFALKAGVDYLQEAATAAADDEAAAKVLAVTMENVTGATKGQIDAMEDWISQTVVAKGVTDDQLRPALNNLIVAYKDADKAQADMGIAMDIATAKGLPLEAVTKAMAKAAQGSMGGMAKLGLAVKDAAGEALTFDQIMQQANKTFGGQATEAANTTAGMMNRLKLGFAEAKEGMGASLLPAMQKFVDLVLQHMPQITSVMEKMGEGIGKVFSWVAENVFPILSDGLGSLLGDAEGSSSGIGEAFGSIGRILMGLKEIFASAWPLIMNVVKMFVDWLAGPTGQALVASLLQAIGTILDALSQVFQAIWPVIQSIVQTFIEFLAGPAGTALIETLLSIVITAVQLVQTTFEKVWPVLQGIVQIFLDFISDPATAALITTLLDVVSEAVNIFAELWGTVWGALGPVLEGVLPIIKLALQPIILAIEAVTATIDALKDAWNWLTNADLEAQTKKHDEAGRKRLLELGLDPSDYGYETGGEITAARSIAGGMGANGAVAIKAHVGEYMLTRGDTALMRELTGAVSRMGRSSGGGVVFTGPITVLANDPRTFLKLMESEVGLVSRSKGGR